jgi:biotin carboxyl carrier protein
VQYEVQVNGRLRQVTLVRREDRFVVSIENRQWVIDAARVGTHLLSLLIDDVASGPAVSREVSIAADPAGGQFIVGLGALPLPVSLDARRKWGRKDDGAAGGSGPQRIVAPMPGKIVRVLTKPGDTVQPRQALVVVEAMKMENELRASRAGIVAEVLVKEGQSVEAGTLLAVVAAS